jgi:hypothetical protein
MAVQATPRRNMAIAPKVGQKQIMAVEFDSLLRFVRLAYGGF